ncbi:MAG: HepT-like ribonuclease domain-containing protein [Candidatus Njordarchaeia archaeon]
MIKILKNAKIIDEETAKKLREMKAFRNFMVHRYGESFEKIAYENIIKGLHDIHGILDKIIKISKKIDP